MISGFVVLRSSWGRTPRQFVRSRFTRLYPAYWFAVSLTAMVTIVVVGHLDGGVVEMRFYAVIFALILIGVTRDGSSLSSGPGWPPPIS